MPEFLNLRGFYVFNLICHDMAQVFVVPETTKPTLAGRGLQRGQGRLGWLGWLADWLKMATPWLHERKKKNASPEGLA